MFKTMFQVPVADNDGNPVGDAIFAAIEARLIDAFGAYSRRANMRGAWKADDGQIYHDDNVTYEVALTRFKQIAGWPTIAEEARQTTRQIALYVEIGGMPDIWDGP